MIDLPNFEIHACIRLGNGLFAGKVYAMQVYYAQEAIITFEPNDMQGTLFRVEKIRGTELVLPGIVDFNLYERIFQVNGQQYHFFKRSEHVGSICYDVFFVTGLTAIRLMNDLYTNHHWFVSEGYTDLLHLLEIRYLNEVTLLEILT